VRASVAPVQHVVWVVFENHDSSQIIGNPDAPAFNAAAQACGLATDFTAEAHPSLPNYIAMTSGGTQGISDDSGPSSHPLNVPNVFQQLGTGWRALEEAMPSNCATSDSGNYAVRHDPAAYYTNLGGACQSQDVPLSDPPDISARFTFVTPSLCHDMHSNSCPGNNDVVKQGDDWLAQWLPKFESRPEYASGHTVIFITFDENSYSGVNHVATIVVGPSTPRGYQNASPYSHYSMLLTTEQLLGLPPIGQAAAAAPMTPFTP
jgi:phosphatidylinositol-3-phosphatase